MKEEETKQKAQWQSEKEQINKIQQNKIDIENLKFEADKAEREWYSSAQSGLFGE